MDSIYIFGHKNPDTDSVCSSIALSYLKNKLGMNTEPRILSEDIPLETKFALSKFKVKIPLYLNDVKVKIKDVKYHKNYLINENKPIIDAYTLMDRHGITGIPIVDDKKYFKGYVSLKEIASEMIHNESIYINTTFTNLLNTLDASDYLKFDDEIEGYAHAATFDDASFIKDIKLDEKSILIVGDRESIINYGLSKKVKLIIMVQGKTLTKNQKDIARQNRVNIITSRKSSFKIARVLCLANPIKSIKRNESVVTFNENDYLSDFNERTSKLKHTNYPIVDNENKCLGMLRTIDSKEINRRKVILVDHNMLDQSADGLYESIILEIIDHHNIGDINTKDPINFRNMSVGSVSTIIYYLYKENGIAIPKNMAGLMLSGIISDTLLLQSPTTTDKDKLVARELAKIAGVNIKTYGIELLESGVSIEGLSANDIIFKDFKIYDVNGERLVIGQVFTTDFNQYKGRVDELIEELNRIEKNNNYKVCALFITNFLTNDSNVLFSNNSKNHLESAYGIKDMKEGELLKGVVSRKKQIVPNILSIFDKM